MPNPDISYSPTSINVIRTTMSIPNPISANNYSPNSPQMYGIICDISKIPELPQRATLPRIIDNTQSSANNFWEDYIYIGYVSPRSTLADLFPSIQNIPLFDTIILPTLLWSISVTLQSVLHTNINGSRPGHYFVKASNPILSTLFPIEPVNILGDFHEPNNILTTDLISIPPKNAILSQNDLDFLNKLTHICNITSEADHVKLELHKITNKLKILHTSLPETYKSQLNPIILKLESLSTDNSFQTKKIDIDL